MSNPNLISPTTSKASITTTNLVVFVRVILFAPEKLKLTNDKEDGISPALIASEVAKSVFGILLVPNVPE